jgi:long-chain acyl-CoA synthetase
MSVGACGMSLLLEQQPMISLGDLLRESARRFADYPAIITADETVNFSTFDRCTDAVAAACAEQGIVVGDRVGLYCTNCAEFAIAYAGIIKTGAAVVPVNLMLTAPEITFILNDAGVKALVYHSTFEETVEVLRADVPSLRFSVCIGGVCVQAIDWSAFLNSSAAVPRPVLSPAEDLAAILYTSGTTGRSKGAMLTHQNLVSNTRSVFKALQWAPGGDIVLVVLPMFHAFAATVGMLTPLTQGCAFVPLAKFEPDLVARTIDATRATIFLGVPSMYSVLLRLKKDRLDLFGSLRYCVSGGAAMPLDVMQRFEAAFGKPIYEGDGPTECSPVTCINPIGNKTKSGTVGLPLPDVEMKVVDEAGKEVPKGTVGEIAVRGPNVMKGYWNLPDETLDVFSGDWFLTGDLGTEDEEGYFSIVDRKKDMLIVNGMNVYPRVVEEVLYRCEGVAEAAVIGEPHALHGEVPVAYVALSEGADLSSADLRAWCRERLGRYQVPRRIHIVPELPKNAAGKVMKRQLRKQGEIERGIDLCAKT